MLCSDFESDLRLVKIMETGYFNVDIAELIVRLCSIPHSIVFKEEEILVKICKQPTSFVPSQSILSRHNFAEVNWAAAVKRLSNLQKRITPKRSAVTVKDERGITTTITDSLGTYQLFRAHPVDDVEVDPRFANAEPRQATFDNGTYWKRARNPRHIPAMQQGLS